MSNKSQNYNVRWMAKIDQELKDLKDVLDNHIVSRLNRLDKRFWWIMGLIVGGILINKLF